MTKIDVPDWVVKAADEAGDEFDRTHTMSMYASVSDRRLDRVRHMLTAALGAWVVPVPQFGDACTDSVWFDGELLETSKDDPFYRTRTLYSLRQEKPE